jgi:hypothetical protein
VGDRLYVRENFARVPATAYRMSEGVQQTVDPNDPDMAAIYAAGWERSAPKWKPSIHMPRWASRLTLVMTAVKTERLQDIGWNDAIAEGIQRGDPMPEVPNSHGTIWHNGVTDPLNDWTRDPTQAFRDLWEAIHGTGAWEKNPELIALTFTVHRVNIDRMKDAA